MTIQTFKLFIAGLLFLTAGSVFAHGGISQGRPAVYEIPIPEELANEPDVQTLATFSVTDVDIERNGDQVEIEYHLPMELTGTAQEIEVTGTIPADGGPLHLSGHGTKAVCPSATDLSNCELIYENLYIDTQARSQILKNLSKTPQELVLREKLAASFCAAASEGRPCGILKIK